MTESMHEYVVDQLQKHKGRWTEVAEGTGMSKRTIEKIARRETKDPGVSLVEQLARYFKELNSDVAAPRPQ